MSGPQRWRWGDPLDSLRAAVERRAVIALPTESSYGLAVDPRSAVGVERIHRLKGRPPERALPVVAADRAQAEALAGVIDDPVLDRLADLWPAPLSLLLPIGDDLAAAAGTGRVAVRVPDHPRLRELLASLGTALTATSANRSGEPALTDPEGVMGLLAGVDAVLVDDGPLPGGNPSTLLGVRQGEPEILRLGAVPRETLAAALGYPSADAFSAASVEILADESR